MPKKFCEIFPLLLTVCTVVKSKGKILQNFVAFSEHINFKINFDDVITTDCGSFDAKVQLDDFFFGDSHVVDLYIQLFILHLWTSLNGKHCQDHYDHNKKNKIQSRSFTLNSIAFKLLLCTDYE